MIWMYVITIFSMFLGTSCHSSIGVILHDLIVNFQIKILNLNDLLLFQIRLNDANNNPCKMRTKINFFVLV